MRQRESEHFQIELTKFAYGWNIGEMRRNARMPGFPELALSEKTNRRNSSYFSTP